MDLPPEMANNGLILAISALILPYIVNNGEETCNYDASLKKSHDVCHCTSPTKRQAVQEELPSNYLNFIEYQTQIQQLSGKHRDL